MAGPSKIEWCTDTWNPIVGCSVVSPGCTNCYAMRFAGNRLDRDGGPAHYRGTTQPSKAGPVWTGKVALAPDHILTAPLRWRKPKRIFVNSMGDLFHEAVPDAWIDRVFAVMALCPQHTFQVLTKRAERMRTYLTKPHRPGQFITITDDGRQIDTPGASIRAHSAMCKLFKIAPARALNDAIAWQDKRDPGGDGFMRRWPLPNVWLGVSCERQEEADERIPHLLATPAAVRFVSAEPLLGPIDLGKHLEGEEQHGIDMTRPVGERVGACIGWSPGLDWVIVGGESGPKARPMHPDWARSLRDQCAAAGVAYFHKQNGEWLQRDCVNVSRHHAVFNNDGSCDTGVNVTTAVTCLRTHVVMERVGKKSAGRLLDGIEHNDMPPTPDGRG